MVGVGGVVRRDVVPTVAMLRLARCCLGADAWWRLVSTGLGSRPDRWRCRPHHMARRRGLSPRRYRPWESQTGLPTSMSATAPHTKQRPETPRIAHDSIGSPADTPTHDRDSRRATTIGLSNTPRTPIGSPGLAALVDGAGCDLECVEALGELAETLRPGPHDPLAKLAGQIGVPHRRGVQTRDQRLTLDPGAQDRRGLGPAAAAGSSRNGVGPGPTPKSDGSAMSVANPAADTASIRRPNPSASRAASTALGCLHQPPPLQRHSQARRKHENGWPLWSPKSSTPITPAVAMPHQRATVSASCS